MATKKTNETKANKATKTKKASPKPKKVEVKEEPVVVEETVENPVEEAAVEAEINQDAPVEEVKETEDALENGEPTLATDDVPVEWNETPVREDRYQVTYDLAADGANSVSVLEGEELANTLSVTEEITPEENNVLETPPQKEPVKKKKRILNTVYRWFGAQVDL